MTVATQVEFGLPCTTAHDERRSGAGGVHVVGTPQVSRVSASPLTWATGGTATVTVAVAPSPQVTTAVGRGEGGARGGRTDGSDARLPWQAVGMLGDHDDEVLDGRRR